MEVSLRNQIVHIAVMVVSFLLPYSICFADSLTFPTVIDDDVRISVLAVHSATEQEVTIKFYTGHILEDPPDSPDTYSFSAGETKQFLWIAEYLGKERFNGWVQVTAKEDILATVQTGIYEPFHAITLYRGQSPRVLHVYPKVFDGKWGWENRIVVQRTRPVPECTPTPEACTVSLYEDSGKLVHKTPDILLPELGTLIVRPSEIMGEFFAGRLVVDCPDDSTSVMELLHRDPEKGTIDALTIKGGW